MGTPSVTVTFSADEESPTLAECLERLLSHLNLEEPEKDTV